MNPNIESYLCETFAVYCMMCIRKMMGLCNFGMLGGTASKLGSMCVEGKCYSKSNKLNMLVEGMSCISPMLAHCMLSMMHHMPHIQMSDYLHSKPLDKDYDTNYHKD